MDYAPLKNTLREFIRGKPRLRRLFYFVLGRLFLRERYVKRALAELMPALGRNLKVMDAGFGYGQYSYHIARFYGGVSVTGIEIEREMLDDFEIFIEKTGMKNIELREIDLTEMTIKLFFDLALSVDVMEHIENDEAVFKNVCQSLREGGVFLIHAPHKSDSRAEGGVSFVGEHVREGYTAEEIVEKLQRAGFGQIEFTYTYGKAGAAAWRLLQKYPIMVLNFTRLAFILTPFYYAVVYPLAEFLMRRDIRASNRIGNGILVKAWKGN